MRALPAVLAAVSLAALPSVGCSAEPPAANAGSSSDAAFGTRVRAYLLDHPEVLKEALARLQAKEEAQEAATAKRAIADHRAALERDGRDPVGGNPTGAVTVTEFFDYRCPYCKVASPALPAFLKAHPNVRLVYKEFPILSQSSEDAAKLALAAKLQGRYEPVHQAMMKAPVLDAAATEAILRDNGVDVARAKADAASPAVTKQVEEVRALARAVGVNATPTFIVGDRLSNGWAPEELDAAIKAAAR